MATNKQGLHYNYDFNECNWLLKRGAIAIGCGIRDKTKNPFMVFLINRKYHELDKEYKSIK